MITIYAINNEINGKVYVGSTSNTQSRWRDHLSALRRGTHHSYRLQKEWDESGESAFKFTVLEEGIEDSERFDKEQFWMDNLESFLPDKGYNISPTAEKTLGRRHTEDAKRKMSVTHSGKQLSDDHKRSISESMKKVVKTPEHQRKITEAIRHRDKSVMARGERVSGAKLTEKKVLEIHEMLSEGSSYKEIMDKYGISKASVYNIKTGRTWAYLNEKKDESEAV